MVRLKAKRVDFQCSLIENSDLFRLPSPCRPRDLGRRVGGWVQRLPLLEPGRHLRRSSDRVQHRVPRQLLRVLREQGWRPARQGPDPAGRDQPVRLRGPLGRQDQRDGLH